MVSQSRSPAWDKNKMYVFSNIAEQEVEYVVFKIIHKDTITFKDIVIGVAPGILLSWCAIVVAYQNLLLDAVV